MTHSAMLILHGKQADNNEVRQAVIKQREGGRDLAVRVTWEGGDAGRYVREALDRGYRTVIAGGFGTEVTSQTSEDLKKMLGGVAYLLTGLTRFTEIRAARGHLSGPDFDWRGEFLALGLGNGRQAGGGQRLCPDALINDGLLDVAILPAEMDLLAGARELFDSEARQTRENGLFVRARVSELRIDTPEPMNLNLDGEPLESRHFNLRVLAHRLALHLPDNSCLLSD